jgi:integrase/recombinase XerD
MALTVYQRVPARSDAGKEYLRYAAVEEGKGIKTSKLPGPFYIRPTVKENGKTTQNWLRLKAENFADAKIEANRSTEALIAQAKGLTVAEAQALVNGGTSIAAAVETFMRLHRNDRPKTVRQYDNALKHLLKYLPNGVHSVKDLANARALDEYLSTLQEQGYAKKTIETRMGVIFSMLKDNKKETGVEYASQLVSIPEPVRKRPKAYSDEDVENLFGMTTDENGKKVRVMSDEECVRYLFFLHTACREQEVMYATWDDVDFKQRKFRVTGDGKEDVDFVPKSHEERWIPLTTELYEALKSRKQKPPSNRWIFVNEDGNPEGHFLRKFKAIAKRAGLNCGRCKTTISEGRYVRKEIEVTCETRPVCEKHYLHRLRKTCATRWLRAGVNLMDIKTWLGHESLAVTQLYLADSECVDDSLQAKLDRAGKRTAA